MAVRELPGIGLTGGYTSGADGWGAAMNQNLTKLSMLVNLAVDGLVDEADLPAVPTEGQIFIVLDGTYAGQIHAWDEGAWSRIEPADGYMALDTSTQTQYLYTSGAWTAQAMTLPTFGPPSAGMVLAVNEDGDGLEWTPANPSIPPYSAPDELKFLRVLAGGTGLGWYSVPALPEITAGDAGKYLKANAAGTNYEWGLSIPDATTPLTYLRLNAAGNALEWATVTAAYPDLTGNDGKFLMVSSGGAAVEWANPYPSIAGNANKVLAVNDAGTGLEWVDLPAGALPTSTSGDYKKVLMVNSSGDAEWAKQGLLEINAVAASSLTISATHQGQLVNLNYATAVTVTIPTDAADNLPIGFSVILRQAGAGQVMVVPDSPATVSVSSDFNPNTRVSGSVATVVKTAANTWVIFGDLESV